MPTLEAWVIVNSYGTTKETGSVFFSLVKKALYRPCAERKRSLMNLCYANYWEQDNPASGPRPSFEDIFPFSQLTNYVQNSFLPSLLVRRVTAWIDDLESAIKKLYQSSALKTENLDKDISDALIAYYRLFWGVLRDSDALLNGLNLQKDPQLREGLGYVFLRTLLNLGCHFRKVDDAGHIAGIVTPFAPRYLSAILETSCLLEGLDSKEPKERLSAEMEILNTFVSRFLRWYLMAPDGTLCHAAARPTTSILQERADICILIRSVADYSSYEGVSELRLFEKIRYEMEQRADGQDDSLHVLIAGDLDADQIIKFGGMLEEWLVNESNPPIRPDSKIIFSLFTDNCSFDPQVIDGWKQCAQDFRRLQMEHRPLRNLFESPKSLKGYVGEADLLFFLDCRQLYEDIYPLPFSSLSAFFQQTAEPNIDSVHRSASGHVLSPNNPFFQVQNLLLGILYGKGEPALLKKEVSTTQLDYIRALLKPQNKTAYFYYSDLDAAQDLYWHEDCFVRSEDYSGKRMVILRFGGKDEPPLGLAPSSREKIIVFNLWQFVKHCNLRRVNRIIEHLGLNASDKPNCGENIYLLSKILIGIDYSNWPKVLHLTYSYPPDDPCFQKPAVDLRLKEYMQDLIVPCFQPDTQNIYYTYFRKCIASFLYSDAKNVDDMLFIHIFKRHFSLLRSVQLDWEDDYHKLVYWKPKQVKYSGKRFYQEVMSDYDEPFSYVADQHRKLTLMGESGKLPPMVVFWNIRKACEENQYSDSNLYRNCTKWLENNGCIP